jgi:hypothetical protein
MTRQISIRLSNEEQHMLRHIQQGSRSETLRMLIRREFLSKSVSRGSFYAVGSKSPIILEVKHDE